MKETTVKVLVFSVTKYPMIFQFSIITYSLPSFARITHYQYMFHCNVFFQNENVQALVFLLTAWYLLMPKMKVGFF